MNQYWKNFLLSIHALIDEKGDITFPTGKNPSENRLHPIHHLSVLKVTGSDAAKFLNGQITCDTSNISTAKGNLGAYCTAKGRTISTFLIIKKEDFFLLILPTDLLEPVKKRLQMFVMHDDVQITDCRDFYCLFGLNNQNPDATSLDLPEQVFSSTENKSVQWLRMSLEQNRYIAIADAEHAIDCWTELLENSNFIAASSYEWQYQDMVSGIPWLTTETTEQYIPQMLNLDQLQGISFSKGCYVGQEIVARTHYLGKAKRTMYLGECDSIEAIAPGTEIISFQNTEPQSVGKVLSSQTHENRTALLIVMQTSSTEVKTLKLNTPNQDKITLTELSYFI